MAKVLTPQAKQRIRQEIFRKADEVGYASSGRIDNGHFMDELVEDPNIGGVLKEYMSKEKVRTYIKDAVLNAYTKQITRKRLSHVSPEKIVETTLHVHAHIIQTGKGKNSKVSVLRSDAGELFVVSGGTLLKWETALRRAIEIIASQPGLSPEGKTPRICLTLAAYSQNLTEADKNYIITALQAINVSAYFCLE
ncbi:MAG: hypothetical protein IKP00_16565 [Victivallales bacterium]|nr:hypothetical protein [Victivallales bacterium]